MNNRTFAFFIVGLLSFADSEDGLRVIFMAGIIAASFEVFYRVGRYLWLARAEALAPSTLTEDFAAEEVERR